MPITSITRAPRERTASVLRAVDHARDAVGDPNDLHVVSIDGEVFTRDHTGNYRFSVETCIAEASRYFTLEPGTYPSLPARTSAAFRAA